MVTLTIREIEALAAFAGLRTTSEGLEESDKDACISVSDIHTKVADDNGNIHEHEHIAYFADYPEEGCVPLGPPLPPNP